MTIQATWLLAGLFAAHFLGDFTPLATPRMQEAKAAGGPIGYIAAHAGIHAALAGVVVWAIVSPAGGVLAIAAATVFLTHFAIDAVRARAAVAVRALVDPNRQAFWTALGVDQLAHGLVLVYVASMVT
ncbi:MAG: DUF3307 domain-containing protein [Gemmatimonadota bacterium]|nr:DUF3307 domain-containing protein [Gemmatimonadota bacterium]